MATVVMLKGDSVGGTPIIQITTNDWRATKNITTWGIISSEGVEKYHSGSKSYIKRSVDDNIYMDMSMFSTSNTFNVLESNVTFKANKTLTNKDKSLMEIGWFGEYGVFNTDVYNWIYIRNLFPKKKYMTVLPVNQYGQLELPAFQVDSHYIGVNTDGLPLGGIHSSESVMKKKIYPSSSYNDKYYIPIYVESVSHGGHEYYNTYSRDNPYILRSTDGIKYSNGNLTVNIGYADNIGNVTEFGTIAKQFLYTQKQHPTPTYTLLGNEISIEGIDEVDSNIAIQIQKYTTDVDGNETILDDYGHNIPVTIGTSSVKYTIPDEDYYITDNDINIRYRIRSSANENARIHMGPWDRDDYDRSTYHKTAPLNNIRDAATYVHFDASTSTGWFDYKYKTPNISIYNILSTNQKLNTRLVKWHTPSVSDLIQLRTLYDVRTLINSDGDTTGYEDYIELSRLKIGSQYHIRLGRLETDWTDILSTSTERQVIFNHPVEYIVQMRNKYNDVYSIVTEMGTTLSKLNTPIFTSGSRSNVNTYIINWSRPDNAHTTDNISYKHYMYRSMDDYETDWSDTTKNTTEIIRDLKYTSHDVYVKALYEENPNFDSDDMLYTITTEMIPKLEVPVLTKTPLTRVSTIDNTENETYGYRFSWNQITHNTDYVYNLVRKESGIEIDNLEVSTGMSRQFDLLNTIHSLGNYTIRVKATANIVYDDGPYTGFDSDWSNERTETVQTLNPISDFRWDNTNPKRPTDIVWSLPANANYTRYRFIPDGSASSHDNYTRSLKINAYDVVGEIDHTTSFEVFAFPYSYNSFRYRSDEPSDILDYDVIKLDKPTNLSYNPDTFSLEWDSVPDANLYEVWVSEHDVWSLRDTTETNSWYNDFGMGNHKVKVVATRLTLVDGYDISKYTNPRYAKSIDSDILSFGTIETPILERTGDSHDTLSWTNIIGENIRYRLMANNSSVDYDGINTQWTFNKSEPSALGTWTYKVKAYTGIEGDVGYIESAWSNEITFTISKLESPTLIEVTNQSRYHWNSIPNATHYDFYVNGILENTFDHNKTISDTVDVGRLNSGTYTVKVVSLNKNNTLNDNPFLFRRSGDSNTHSFYNHKIKTPEIEYDPITQKVEWLEYKDDYMFDNSYPYTFEVQLFDESIGSWDTVNTTSLLNYDFSYLSAGTYQVRIRSIYHNVGDYPDPKFIDSELSNVVSFGTLGTPVLSLNSEEGYIYWTDVPMVEYYQVYVNDEIFLTTTNTSMDIDVERLKPGETLIFNFKVHARNDDPNMYDDESISNTVTYIFYKLDSPIPYLTEGNIIVWDPIPNADKYILTRKDVEYSSTTSTSFVVDLASLPGKTEWEVYAVSNRKNYLDSGLSPTIVVTKPVSFKYVLVIDPKDTDIVYDEEGNIISATKDTANQVEVWLPFTIEKSLDGSLDNATVITAPIDRKLPFEKDTKVEFYVYDDNLEGITFDKILGDHRHVMLVDTDEVEEVQIGDGSKWKHTISLVDRTRELQYEYISLSISQSLDHIKATYDKSDFRPRVIVDMNDGIPLVDFTNDVKIPNVPKNPTSVNQWIGHVKNLKTGWKNDYIVDIPGTVRSNETINLPYPDTQEHIFNTGHPWWTFKDGKATGRSTWVDETKRFPMIVKWYYRKYNSGGYNTYSYGKHSSEKLISRPQEGWTPPSTGRYDLIMEIEPITYYWYMSKNMGLPYPWPQNDVYKELTIKPMLKGINKWSTSIGTIKETKKPNPTGSNIQSIFTENTQDFRIVYRDIEVVDHIGSILFDINEEALTVKHAIEKVLSSIRPVTDPSKENKYTLDKTSAIRANNVICPDISWENKNVYEILLELGTLFQSIPKLGADNKITFYHINEMPTNSEFQTNSDLGLHTEPKSINSPKTSYSTGFVSNLENLITNNQIETFPQGNVWYRARSQDAGIVNIENYQITLPRKIKNIVDITVRNIPGIDPLWSISIRDYLYEKKIYDSMDATNVSTATKNSKTRALWYEYAGNVIGGLGRIPGSTEMNATLGLNETKYIIQYIIENIVGEQNVTWNRHSIKNLEYKVYYETILDSKVIVERSNIADTKKSSYKYLNQDSGFVSNDMFSQSTARQLERLSNRSSVQTYRLQKYQSAPKLGNWIYVDDEKYYADKVIYTYLNNYVEVSANYTERINKLNERMRPDTSYRTYRMDDKSIVDRDIRFDEYVYITRDISRALSKHEETNKRDMSKIRNDILQSFKIGPGVSPAKAPNTLYFRSLDEYGNGTLYYRDGNDIKRPVPKIALPLSYTKLGNSMLFTATTKSNYSAGNTISGEKIIPINRINYYRNFNTEVRYVDNDGRIPYMDIMFMRSDDDNELSINPSNTLPLATEDIREGDVDPEKLLLAKKVNVNKDMRERIRFQYQLHFQTYDKDIQIHPWIADRIYDMELPGGTNTNLNNRKLEWFAYTGDPTQYNIINQFKLHDIDTESVVIDGSSPDVIWIDGPRFIGDLPQDYDGYGLRYISNTDKIRILFTVREHKEKGIYNNTTNKFSEDYFFYKFSPEKLVL